MACLCQRLCCCPGVSCARAQVGPAVPVMRRMPRQVYSLVEPACVLPAALGHKGAGCAASVHSVCSRYCVALGMDGLVAAVCHAGALDPQMQKPREHPCLSCASRSCLAQTHGVPDSAGGIVKAAISDASVTPRDGPVHTSVCRALVNSTVTVLLLSFRVTAKCSVAWLTSCAVACITAVTRKQMD